MKQTEILLLLGVFVVGLFVVYWLKKHRHAGHNQALAAQLKRYPSVRKAWLAAGVKREAVLLVPGLKKATAAVATTATAKAETRLYKHADQCQAMTPQGLAVSEDYLFLSAYCSQQEHHSQLYIIERTSGRHLKTVVLPKRPHVGGLVFDRATQVLWLTITGKGMGRVACVSLQTLLEDDSLATSQPIAYQQVIELAGITHSSYLAADSGELVSGWRIISCLFFQTAVAKRLFASSRIREGSPPRKSKVSPLPLNTCCWHVPLDQGRLSYGSFQRMQRC